MYCHLVVTKWDFWNKIKNNIYKNVPNSGADLDIENSICKMILSDKNKLTKVYDSIQLHFQKFLFVHGQKWDSKHFISMVWKECLQFPLGPWQIILQHNHLYSLSELSICFHTSLLPPPQLSSTTTKKQSKEAKTKKPSVLVSTIVQPWLAVLSPWTMIRIQVWLQRLVRQFNWDTFTKKILRREQKSVSGILSRLSFPS